MDNNASNALKQGNTVENNVNGILIDAMGNLEIKDVSKTASEPDRDMFEINKRLNEENQALRTKVQELEGKVAEMSQSYEEQISDLTNSAIDKDFERGIFVESEVLNKLEQENMQLRKTLEEFYKKTLKEWYEEMRMKYNCEL